MMKTILISLLALSALATSATTLRVAWDEMPTAVDGFHIYAGDERIGSISQAGATTPFTDPKTGEILKRNETSITIPDEEVTLTVTAYNDRGESPRSEPLVIPALPPQVQAYVVTINGELTITIRAKAPNE